MKKLYLISSVHSGINDRELIFGKPSHQSKIDQEFDSVEDFLQNAGDGDLERIVDIAKELDGSDMSLKAVVEFLDGTDEGKRLVEYCEEREIEIK